MSVSIPQIAEALLKLHDEIEAAQSDLESAGLESARMRSEYRKHKALAFTRIKAEAALGGGRVTNPDVEAQVDIDCEPHRLASYMAEASEYSAKQNHRRLLDVLSSWQTLAGMLKEEARFTRTGGDMR